MERGEELAISEPREIIQNSLAVALHGLSRYVVK